MESIGQKGTLKLASYNIRNGKGMDGKTDLDRTVSVIKNMDADVIALQEVDSMTKRNEVDVLKYLEEKLKLNSVFGAAISYQGGKYGVGLLSKQKPIRHYTIPLPGKEEERVLLVVEFKKYIVFSTHLSLTEADRNTSVEIINQQAALFTKPVYLFGDLNAEPQSTAMTLLKRDWNLLSGEAPTFPATNPTKCIDFILSRNSKKERISTTVIEEPMASDHRPLLVTIKE